MLTDVSEVNAASIIRAISKLFALISVIFVLTSIPSVVVEWLTLLLRIREVPASDVGPETSYPDRFSVAFLSPFRHMSG
jgi:hypothetical protein